MKKGDYLCSFYSKLYKYLRQKRHEIPPVNNASGSSPEDCIIYKIDRVWNQALVRTLIFAEVLHGDSGDFTKIHTCRTSVRFCLQL